MKEDQWMVALLGIGCLSGGVALGYYIIPELLKLFVPQEQRPKQAIVIQNPAPKEEVRRLKPKYMMNKSSLPKPVEGIPIKELPVRYSGS